MTRVPKRSRLQLPRDLQVAYTIGRMGAVTAADLWPVFWGSPATARYGFRRLLNLNVLRSFPRSDPAATKWFSLTDSGVEWVAAEAGCADDELKRYVGLARLNLSALQARNRFWVSLIMAARASSTAKLEQFRPEWTLRRVTSPDVSVVPDAIVVIGSKIGYTSMAWMVELDGGSERSAVWRAKAVTYASLRSRGPLYGAARWRILALVPSPRRARTVAGAVVAGGAGPFTWIGVAATLEGGRAFGTAFWTALELVHDSNCVATHSLTDDHGDGRPYPDDVPRRSGTGTFGNVE